MSEPEAARPASDEISRVFRLDAGISGICPTCDCLLTMGACDAHSHGNEIIYRCPDDGAVLARLHEDGGTIVLRPEVGLSMPRGSGGTIAAASA